MLFASSQVDWLLPMPIFLVGLLIALAARAWHARRPTRWALLLAAIWATVLSIPALANGWIGTLEGPVSDPADRPVIASPRTIIVVPGSGESSRNLPGARLNLAGLERLHSAVALWKRTGGLLVFAGGLDDDPQRSLAARMGTLAQELGVPADAIALSARSTNTHEDIAGSVQAIGDRPVDGPVWIVTSALHMKRTLAVARRAGLGAARPWPCDFRQIQQPGWRAWLPNNGGPETFALALHEVVGLMYYRWRGWA